MSHMLAFSPPQIKFYLTLNPQQFSRMPSNSSSALSPPTAPLLLKNSSVAPLKHDGHHLDIFLFVLNTDNYDKIREIINTNKYNQHLEEKKKNASPGLPYEIYIWLSFLFFFLFFGKQYMTFFTKPGEWSKHTYNTIKIYNNQH